MRRHFRRTFVLGIFALLAALVFCTAAYAATAVPDDIGHKIVLQLKNPYMTVDGIQQEIDPGRGTTSITINGTTMVPISAIVNSLGGTVNFDADDMRLDIKLKSNAVKLWLNQATAEVNGTPVTLGTPPQSVNGRTMVPLRFVGENLDCEVAWDGANQSVTIIAGGSSQSSDTPPVTPFTPAGGTTADFSGTWELTVNGEEGHKLVLEQNGSDVIGYSGYDEESGHRFIGKVSGNALNGKFYTTNPVTEWEFKVTMSADGRSFDGLEYYSNPAYTVHGDKVAATVTPSSPAGETTADFSGTWQVTASGEDYGDWLVLEQDGNQVTGYQGYDEYSGHPFRGTVAGNKLIGEFYSTNPVTEWDFEATMSADGRSFDGTEY